jgi:hypothetical protein
VHEVGASGALVELAGGEQGDHGEGLDVGDDAAQVVSRGDLHGVQDVGDAGVGVGGRVVHHAHMIAHGALGVNKSVHLRWPPHLSTGQQEHTPKKAALRYAIVDTQIHARNDVCMTHSIPQPPNGVFAWILIDRLTGTIQEVEFGDTPPNLPHDDEDTMRLVFQGNINGGDSIELTEAEQLAYHRRGKSGLRNVRTAIWNNEA